MLSEVNEEGEKAEPGNPGSHCLLMANDGIPTDFLWLHDLQEVWPYEAAGSYHTNQLLRLHGDARHSHKLGQS